MSLFLRPILALTLALPLAMSLAMPLPAQAKSAPETLECQIVKRQNNLGWVPEVVVVARVPGAGTALINDPIIQQFEKRPKEVPVAEETARRVSYKWTVATSTGKGKSAPMLYRLSINKADLTATIRAQPSGFDNNFSSNGTCRRIAG